MENIEKNPFKIPTEIDVLAQLEQEKKQNQETREKLKTMSLIERSVQKKNIQNLLKPDEDDLKFIQDLENERDQSQYKTIKADRTYLRENLHDFVSKKREIFFLQYALQVKLKEIEKLEKSANSEELALLDEEKALEEDAARFDAFLKENDKSCVEAIKKFFNLSYIRAEQESKIKMERIQELKKLNNSYVALKTEMSKNEDQLNDLKRYRDFLQQLTPKEWFEQTKKDNSENQNSDEQNADEKEEKEKGEEMYFKDPQQLLLIFQELEESNLSLIQSCQESEEALDDLKNQIQEAEESTKIEVTALKQQIETLNQSIHKEEERSKELEEKTKIYSNGDATSDKQATLLDALNQKIKQSYHKCIGDHDANMSALSMLTAMETKLEKLFEIIESMPADKVEHAEKLKDKERRQRLREEKIEAQRLLQEERVKKALERANNVQVGTKKPAKRIVFRSKLPEKGSKKAEKTVKKSADDLAFYLDDN